METLPRIGNDFRQATEHDSNELKGGEEGTTFPTTAHILRDSFECQNMAMRTVDAAAPPEVCVDIGQGPQCREPDVLPSVS